MPDGRATSNRVMRFAYADPPYPGQAKLYRGHRDYDGEVDHVQLVKRLMDDYPDGWALSTSTPALGYVLGLLEGVDFLRTCAWMRGVVPRPPARVMWSWEPVVVRAPVWRRRSQEPFIRDSLVCMQPTGFLGNELPGQKPSAFCRWVFNLLGAQPGDQVDDLFPGSGAVGREWESWSRQLGLWAGANA